MSETSERPLVVCGIAGSLRRSSFNRALLRAAQELAPPGMAIRVFDRMAEVPLFNQDVESAGDPEPIQALERAIAEADALPVATPEYNHGAPGVLKNAIDWASRPPGRSVLAGKPAAILGASPGVTGTAPAQTQLRQAFVFTDTPALPQPEILVYRAHEKFDAEGPLTDAKTREFVGKLLHGLADWTRQLAREGYATSVSAPRRLESPATPCDAPPTRQDEPMTLSDQQGRTHPDERDAAAGGAGAPPRPDAPNRAPPVTREYGTDRITVEWRAERCIHSANCIRALPKVFDPRRRPWVDIDAADADAIAHAVLRCPTGALQFVRHDGGAPETPDVPTTLTPIRNGPLYVRGDVEVRALDGHVIRLGTRVSLCRCGLAQQIPFCDNTCRKEHWHELSDPAARSGPTGGPESAPPSAD